MPKTKKNLTASGIKESSGIDDRGFGFEGPWLNSFKRDFEKGYRKFWAKRGIDPSLTFKDVINSPFIKT